MRRYQNKRPKLTPNQERDEGCTTAAEGQVYWNSAPLKPEEIQL